MRELTNNELNEVAGGIVVFKASEPEIVVFNRISLPGGDSTQPPAPTGRADTI